MRGVIKHSLSDAFEDDYSLLNALFRKRPSAFGVDYMTSLQLLAEDASSLTGGLCSLQPEPEMFTEFDDFS